ncbi:hypothetical protein [Aquipseudomonas alcaligenes]|uniref:hypothetical protein n=1 Tax=Aquipseudomonas alcaligenes TaxID=43263 RepID=UPI001F47632B|nr:hypothetical protein [Pseudomonas alcaligenes]
MRRKALIDSELLSFVASIYFEANARTGDHRQAFVETVRRALLEGYQPHAAWVTDAMLRTGSPTHAVLLSHPEASMAFSVVVGGVSVGWADQLLESEVYTPETWRGWRLIEGEAVELYMRWARQEPVEQEYAMGMEP